MQGVRARDVDCAFDDGEGDPPMLRLFDEVDAGWRLGPRPAWTVAGYRPFAAETLIERHPAFSPDGRTLAYAAGPDVESRRILLRSLTGGPPVWLTSGPGDDYAPTWSPAGDRVAFARYIMGKPCQILVRRLDSGPETPVGACRHDDRTRLAWSHDGARIYFTDGAAGSGPAPVRWPGRAPEGPLDRARRRRR